MIALLRTFLARLRFPQLFMVAAALLALDFIAIDPIPWVDEALLAVATLGARIAQDTGQRTRVFRPGHRGTRHTPPAGKEHNARVLGRADPRSPARGTILGIPMSVLAVLRAAQVTYRLRLGLLGLAFLFATVASAQESSETGLVVLVTNEKGAGVPDALVFIQQAEGAQRLEPVRTDERGRAEVSGLASGDWQVDVRREGFMLYTGFLVLVPGERPEVGFSSKQRTGSYWASLNVSYAGLGQDPLLASSKKAQRKAERDLAQKGAGCGP